MKKSHHHWLAFLLILIGLLVLLGAFGGFPLCVGYALPPTFLTPSVCLGYPLNLSWVFGTTIIILGFAFYRRRR